PPTSAGQTRRQSSRDRQPLRPGRSGAARRTCTLFPRSRRRPGLAIGYQTHPRAEFRQTNRRPIPETRAAKITLRLLHSGFYAVEASRTVWHLIAILANLKLAVAIGGAD